MRKAHRGGRRFRFEEMTIVGRVLRKPLDLVHGFLHSRSLVSNQDRPLYPNSGAFEDYLDFFSYHCDKNMTWRGKVISKTPSDAWIYQEIIHETKPDVVIEVGNWLGGSTLFLADILELEGHGRVIGIDIDHSSIDFKHPRIAWITGDANSNDSLAEVRAQISEGERAMVVEDSSHTFDNTLAVLRNYCQFVSKNHYFIVEDTNCRLPFAAGPRPGPYEAVHEFLKENPCFEIDKTREKFVITSNFDGYLKRIR